MVQPSSLEYGFYNKLQQCVLLNTVKIFEILNNKLKKDIGLNKAAIVMIDCDLYASTKIVLDFITDLIDSGTIIIFDDWYSFKADPNMGEQKACNEWVEKNKNINLIPYGKYGHNFQMSFIVNKK